MDKEPVSSSAAETDVSSLLVALQSSSTSKRTAGLQSLAQRLSAEDYDPKSIPKVLKALVHTYRAYVDRRSRTWVLRCLSIIFLDDEFTVEQFSAFIKHVNGLASQVNIAATDALVLLNWYSILLGYTSTRESLWQKELSGVVSSISKLLEQCAGSDYRRSVKESAFTVTRRGIRGLLHPDNRNVTLQTIVTELTDKGKPGGARNSVLLGQLVITCVGHAELRETIQQLKPKIYEYYLRDFLGSKVVLPAHVTGGLNEFFKHFTTVEDVQSTLLPAIEKGLLRAPEVVLEIVRPFFASLSLRIDLSDLIAGKLLKSLLSNVKSSNPKIPAGALAVYEAVLSKCRKPEVSKTVVKEILSQFKATKVSLADQRSVLAQMLSGTPLEPSTSLEIVESLTSAIDKEQNEQVLRAATKAIFRHLTIIVSSGGELPDKAKDCVVKGLADKKSSIKAIWILRTGEFIWSLRNKVIQSQQPGFVALIKAVTKPLLDAFNDVVTNPRVAQQTGLLIAGYTVVAITLKKLALLPQSDLLAPFQRVEIPKAALKYDDSPSFLLNHRLYAKLTSEDDQLWALRAIFSLTDCLKQDDVDSSSGESWIVAFIYFIVAENVSYTVKREARLALSAIYIRSPKLIRQFVLTGIWYWRWDNARSDPDGAPKMANSGMSRIYEVIRCICIRPQDLQKSGAKIDQEDLMDQLAELVVLCQPQLIPNSPWIETCQRVGVDPGDLARKRATKLIGHIKLISETSGRSQPLKDACYSAAATLCFVEGQVMIPKIVDFFKRDLDPSRLIGIGVDEVGILRTPEGVLYNDPLTKNNEVENKNVRDYETLKWEAELRAQLAAKKGNGERKLTPDQQARVKAQLEKEGAIRKKVHEVELLIERGIGFIHGLAVGPPTDVVQWMSPAIACILDIVKAGGSLLLGQRLTDVYLECANQISPRLGYLRPFIGVATLRTLELATIPPELQDEPLGALITRLFHRIRFMGEQRAFDAATVVYILPLAFLVLLKGSVDRQEQEDKDEQIVLAIEIISSHTDACSDPRMSKVELINTLILALQKYTQHYRILKDCLQDLLRCVGDAFKPIERTAVLSGLLVPQSAVRNGVLQAINSELDLTVIDFSNELWIAYHDTVNEVAELAKETWEENALEIESGKATDMLPYLQSPDRQLRIAAARGLIGLIRSNKTLFQQIVTTLEEIYIEKAKIRDKELDEYGMVKKVDYADPWQARSGIALAFNESAIIFDPSLLVEFIRFLITQGPLSDKSAAVRSEFVEAASSIITLHGKEHVEHLMKMFEETLDAPDTKSEKQDFVNEGVIVLYGALARHLGSGDSRLPKVIDRLILTLTTPSEAVQSAVSECLQPLVRKSDKNLSKIIEDLVNQLLKDKTYASRRGAAYGLAGVVAGRGVYCLREFRVLTTLKAATEDKKNANSRQGALFAYEILSVTLGPLFEPYVIQIVPQLLVAFGDANADVREACLDASKVFFSNLSSFGVKQILPTLLDGLDETQWRSKKGACELLGSMAYLDPEQLASSLPQIIPPLTTVLTDSHKEVRAAANRSLQRFGEVIQNPEIKGLVNVLLKALSDPTKYTNDALDSLIKVSFVHYLDAPSLALVARILERGLVDKSSTKRKASQIIGSLAHLTERKDLTLHLPKLVAGLKLAIVDPVPTTRATSSKALGSLVEKLGEDALPDLIPGLMTTLKSDTGAGDRLGSAQALSEVLAGLGTERLEETLPTILQNVQSAKPSVREGFMSLFIYLPACFGNSFSQYLSKIIPPVLAGLADDIETIRETALRAARLLVKNFSSKSIDLLLPELERGMSDDSYRIRLSSVELVGDLLFNLTGISGPVDNEEEDEPSVDVGASLLETLGEERRNRVLASLYICRCDTSGQVKSAAINVWKAVVSTPKTLKDLIPTLTLQLIKRLASSNAEHKEIAGNALGELIRKTGESLFATLIPTLESSLLTSSDADSKQGICIALRELMYSAAPESLEPYEKTLVECIRAALVDIDEDVRESAADAFDVLQSVFGKRAIDQVLPHLLIRLRSDEGAESALSALLTLLTDEVRSNVILPNLLPTLLKNPITSFNARAIASLSEVAGASLARRLSTILNSLLDNIVECDDEELEEDLCSSFDTVLLSVDDSDSLDMAMNILVTLAKHDDHRKRAAINERLAAFFEDAEVDYSKYTPGFIRVLLISFDDSDPEVVKTAWTALNALIKTLSKPELEHLVSSTYQVLKGVGVPGANLAGFSLPKGIAAILPVFLQGLISGPPEQRVDAAQGICDIIDKTSADSLKPFVTNITGPLIRVMSERSAEVKSAVLLALNKLLEKIPLFLKPFLPQLQRTFAKCLAETGSDTLRVRAAKALGTLITLTPRIDPLVGELVSGCKTEDPIVRAAMIKALHEVVSKAGSNMSEASRASVLELVAVDPEESEGVEALVSSSFLLSAVLKSLPTEEQTNILRTRVLTGKFTRAAVINLNAILLECPLVLTESAAGPDLPNIICQGMTHKDTFIAENCVLAIGKYLLLESTNKTFETTKDIFENLADIIKPGGPTDTRRVALVVVRTFSRLHFELMRPHIPVLASPIFASVRDIVIPVKLAAEAAFITLFQVVSSESAVFEKYIQSPAASTLSPTQKRSMQDYFRRVALRLAEQERERREAEGGAGGLGLSDEQEDEEEVWKVGGGVW